MKYDRVDMMEKIKTKKKEKGKGQSVYHHFVRLMHARHMPMHGVYK